MSDTWIDMLTRTQLPKNAIQACLWLGNMMQHGGSKHMCLLSVFVFFVFVALYWLLKTTR